MSNPLTDPKSDSKQPRRFPRHMLDVRVSVHAFRSGESVSFWGRSSEIGEDGVGATLTGELEPGEVVSMELSLPMTPSWANRLNPQHAARSLASTMHPPR